MSAGTSAGSRSIQERDGWTLVTLERRVGWRPGSPLTAMEAIEVHTFDLRTGLFGGNAPHQSLVVTGATTDWSSIGDITVDGADDAIELDGDHAALDRRLLAPARGQRLPRALPGRGRQPGRLGALRDQRQDDQRARRHHARASTASAAAGRSPTPSRARWTPTARRATTRSPARCSRSPATDPLPVGRRLVVTGFAPGTVPSDPLVAAATPPPQAEAVTVARVRPRGRGAAASP